MDFVVLNTKVGGPNPGLRWQDLNRALRRPTVIYVNPEKSNALNDFLQRAGVKPAELTYRQLSNMYRKAGLHKDGLRALGLSEDTQVKWRQNAGCPCGCSPGFVVEGYYGKWVHVTYAPNPETQEVVTAEGNFTVPVGE